MKTIKISQLIALIGFFSLLVISCSSNQKNEDITVQDKESFTETFSNAKETTTATGKQFEEVQDSLRQVLLDSKSNENLKAGLLQEFYLRALVDQKEDKILFNLPFNIHGLDCGAPDCYSTDISFSIPLSEPLEFPDKIDFKLIEQGCIECRCKKCTPGQHLKSRYPIAPIVKTGSLLKYLVVHTPLFSKVKLRR